MESVIDRMRVAPGDRVRLGSIATDDTFGWEKKAALRDLEKIKARLDLLQHRMFAEDRRSVLLVLQAMDAAGKDGTIRSILSGLNPAGVSVAPFGVPGGPEAEHDYLWRVHAQAPSKGRIVVFNRSHYEDVLVVRVKGLAPKRVWARRYEHIREFEDLLSDEGTTVVKCFLHVSKEVQRERLQERIDDPEKRWKFRHGDLDDRALWPAYTRAYAEALSLTSTPHAPWYVVPADRNWVRNVAVARILLHHLERLDPQLPDPEEGIEGLVVE